MCNPKVKLLANTITSNLSKLAGLEDGKPAPEGAIVYETSREHKATTILYSLIDMINLMYVDEKDGEMVRQPKDIDTITVVARLAIDMLIDVLTKLKPAITKLSQLDEVMQQPYLRATKILTMESQYDTKNNLVFAKSLVIA